MSDVRELASIAVLGAAWSGFGLVLLVVPRVRASAALMVLTGVVGAFGAALAAAGRLDAATACFAVAGVLLGPLALTCYPTYTMRHPMDLVAVVAIVAAGGAVVLRPHQASMISSAALVVACVLLGHTWWKLERADPADRRALTWMALAMLVTGAVFFLAGPGVAGSVFAWISLAAVPASMALGLRRPEVVDVRGIVVEVAVFATAMLGYLAIFMVIESGLELSTGGLPRPAILAMIGALAATALHPFRVLVRGTVDELLFGSRPDPLDAAARVAGHAGDDPARALSEIRHALVLPYVALVVHGETVSSSGTAVTYTRTVPLEPGGASELVVGLRPGDLILSAGDRNVLALVAPLLAQTLRAQALAEDLRASRTHTVAALEEERRRLRRDLHDGLGPRLSGIAFTADAARNLIYSDQAGAEALLKSLRAETTTAIEEIRRIVYAMRPPALDELGLVLALRQQAATMSAVGGRHLQVSVRAPERLPRLTAAVEVAAYRIVVEALMNVTRHTSSPIATIRLDSRPGGLAISVADTDAGQGDWTAGVGISSMRERAAELGGRLTAGPTREGGLVEAYLPIAAA